MLALFVFLAVGAIVASFVALAARRATEGARARAEAEALLTARRLLTVSAVLDSLRRVLGLDGAAVLRREEGGWRVEAASGNRVPESPEASTSTIELDAEHLLVLAGGPIRSEDQRVLDAFAESSRASVHLGELEAEAETAGTVSAANELRAAMLSAVSHDLRTPSPRSRPRSPACSSGTSTGRPRRDRSSSRRSTRRPTGSTPSSATCST